jgi:hypothetical protein
VVGVPKEAIVALQLAASSLALIAAGQVIVGFCVSVTVTICVQVAVNPLASVTVQVTVVEPVGYAVDGWLFVTEATEQLSAVVGVPKEATVASHEAASAFTLMAAGQVMVGFCVSVTVTTCEQVAVKPLASMTVQVTVVEPVGYAVDGWLFVTEATEQLSAVVGVPNKATAASQLAASAFTLIAAGQVMVGFCVSVTVTTCVQVAVKPLASVAVHVTVVAPVG